QLCGSIGVEPKAKHPGGCFWNGSISPMCANSQVVRLRPQSTLGQCVSSWIKDKGHLLIALESYFDGSNEGGWLNGSFITLAGFAADDSIWTEFDERWNE